MKIAGVKIAGKKTVGFDISALDPSFKEHAQRGIGRYVRELDKYFQSASSEICKVETFDHRQITGEFVNRVINKIPYGRQTLAQQILFPLQLTKYAKNRFNFLHFPAHMDPPAWGMTPYFVTVLDLIPLVLTDLYKAQNPSWRFKLARFLDNSAIKNAAHIFAISQSTANDINRLLGIPFEKITVTPLGVDEKFFTVSNNPQNKDEEIRAKYKIPEGVPVILYVGGIDPRKNYTLLVETISEVIKARKAQEKVLPVCVMSGRIEKDKEFPKLQRLIQEKNLQNYIILPGFIPDEDLLRIYNIISVFFFPSLYEGFGLPVLEAMAAGVPIVALNNSSIPEIVGHAFALIENSSSQATKALLDILDQDGQARENFLLARTRAKEFSWEKTGKLTLAAYEKF